jgi:hypothetical protein
MAQLKSGTRIYGDAVVDEKLQLTAGPILVGSATSTGTASQPLQVSGGAYVSGNLGIGTTTPTRALDVNGELRLRNALYDVNNNVGTGSSVLVSTGVGVSWTPISFAALQGVQGTQGIQGSDAVVQGIQGIQGTQGTQGIQGTQGTQGIQGFGVQGTTGSGVTIIGSVADVNVNPPNNPQTTLNSAFPSAISGNGVIDTATGDLWVYNGATWINVGVIRGPQGIQGITGTATQGTQGIQGITGTATQGIQGIQGTQGTQGIQGTQGNRGGIPYTFSTTTTDADPGTGVIRYNNAVVGSVTQIFIDNTDSLSNTQTGWYDTWDDSSNTTSEGYLYITSASSSGTTVNVWNVTAVTAASGYYKITATFISGSLPTDADTLAVNFTRTGDRGVQGATGTATQGIQGITGGNGANGASVQGANGTQGIQGIAGAGTQGTTGATGSTGPVAGTANQVVYKDSGNSPAGSANLTFDGTNLVCGGTVTASSDEKIKENITTIENALEKVLNLRGVEFDYKIDGVHSIGFIAQEVEKIFPDLVFGTDPKSIAYQNFVAILVEAIKELNQKVDRLTNNQI